MSEPIFMRLGMHIMTPELILTAYFINPFHQPLCLCVYICTCISPFVTRLWFGKTFPRQQIHIQQIIIVGRVISYAVLVVSKGSVGLSVSTRCAATRNCWTSRFLCGPCRIKGKQAISSSQNILLDLGV
jgi:hypothetical protein